MLAVKSGAIFRVMAFSLVAWWMLTGCSTNTGQVSPAQAAASSTSTPNFNDPKGFVDFPPAPAASGQGAAGGSPAGPSVVAAEKTPEATDSKLKVLSNNPASPNYAGLPHSNPARAPFDARYEQLPGYAEVAVKTSPLPARPLVTPKVVELWKANCEPCHGNGTGNQAADAVLAGSMRDLSNPFAYRYGASDIAVYRSIKFGLPNSVMGNFKTQLNESQLWQLVGYVKSLQKT